MARRSRILNFYCHPWEFVPTASLQLPANGSVRHQRSTGPHHLAPLRTFLERVLAAGYTPATFREVAACEW